MVSNLCVILCSALLCSQALAQNKPAGGAPVFAGKKVLLINSYHQGYEWSDGIEQGIRDTLDGAGVELRVFRMDTKRKPDDASKQAAGVAAKAVVEEFKPDVVIASDDNAQIHCVVPFLKNTALPVVFCGVNWDASAYGYPCANVTGMVEVDLVEEMVKALKPRMKGERIGYISGNDETEMKIVDVYSKQFFGEKMKHYGAGTFEECKAQFLRAQQESDILFFRNNASIKNWDAAAAEKFFRENTRIPTVTVNEWMAPFVVLCMAHLGAEQGEYAAQTALRILSGTKPADIPVVENKKARLVVNLKLAEAAGIVFPASMLKTAELIGKE